MGRKATQNLTSDQLNEVETLGAILSMEQVADYFGVPKTTFYRLIDRQPAIMERYKKGKAKAIGIVAKGLLMQAREGNLTAQMFYLKTQAGWRETQKIDHSSEDGSMTPTKITRVIVKNK